MVSRSPTSRSPACYKSTTLIGRAFGVIRKGKVTDGRLLRDVVTNDNTASEVWADSAYRSQANERWLRRQGKVSRIHRRKPKGRPMPERTAKATPPRPRSVPASSLCSRTKRQKRACSFAPSVSATPRPGSPSPIWPAT